MKPQAPQPVKLFIGLLYNRAASLGQLYTQLADRFNRIDYKSPEYEFSVTDYYVAEMGRPLYRQFLSFDKLIDPGKLAGIKIATNQMEADLADGLKRHVNLDPGYMDYNKIVLASAKYNGQKIYLSHGIYADPTLWYEKGDFIPYDHSFPDFKQPFYSEAFKDIRTLYKSQLRSQDQNG